MTLEFDRDYYLLANPDVKAAGIDALTHYQQYGAREGRDPNGYFDEGYYLASNPDVAAAVANGSLTSGYQHYTLYGASEHRNATELFNEAYYLSRNGDVAAAVTNGSFINGYTHFLLYGQTEGRAPVTGYNESNYLTANPDVAAAVSQGAFASGWAHFALYGKSEPHRSGVDSELFSDIAEVPTEEPILEIIPSNTVDEAWYRSAYIDVDATINEGLLLSGQQHYDLYGKKESRMPSSDIALAGNDNITGSAGADTMHGGAGNDTINGSAGNDMLFGETGNDSMIGGDGADTMNSGSGADTMAGGLGNDVYFVDDIGDQVLENPAAGTDLIGSTISFTLSSVLENLTFLGKDDLIGIGNEIGNVITGNMGNNELRGEDGDDTIRGGAGDDKLYGGAGNDMLYGESGNDLLQADGTLGSQTLDGGAGVDTMIGSSGNNIHMGDYYVVDNANDIVIDPSSIDGDTVFSTASYVLPDNIETFILAPSDTVITGTGNNANNTITGYDRSYVGVNIQGLAGDDTIRGGQGNDSLYGGDGNDVITANNNDIIFGDNGNDTLSHNGAGNTIHGGAGDDNFIGVKFVTPIEQYKIQYGAVIYGDEGSDHFQFNFINSNEFNAHYMVMDFSAEDKIAIGRSFPNGFADLLTYIQNDIDGNALISFAANYSITIVGTSKEELVASDFTFA